MLRETEKTMNVPETFIKQARSICDTTDWSVRDWLGDMDIYAEEDCVADIAKALMKERQRALEDAACLVERRGREVGGAVNPTITSAAIRALMEKENTE